MTTANIKPTRKITISLPGELVAFTDSQVKQNNTSRSWPYRLVSPLDWG